MKHYEKRIMTSMTRNRLPHIYPLIILVLCMGIPFQTISAQDDGRSPVEASATFTGELFSNLTGGSDTGIRFMDNVDLELNLNLEEGLGWNGTQIYLYGLGNQGGSITELTGDLQGVSNIEAETSWRLYEAWIQTYIDGLRMSLLAGLYDLNSEFDVIGPAGLFINSSHGIGPEYSSSGMFGPSIFPYTSAGLRLRVNPLRGIVFKAALLDGVPSDPGNTDGTKVVFRGGDGLLFAGEVVFFADAGNPGRMYLGRDLEREHPFRLVLGGWAYSKKRIGWIGEPEEDRGAYLLAEYKIFSESENLEQGLTGFVRFGVANEDIISLKNYLGAGLVYTGLFDKRPSDKAGIALALPFNSETLKTTLEDSGIEATPFEMNIEVTYLMELNRLISLQLDLQYIVHPGMLSGVKNALAAGTRLQLAL